MSDIQVKDITKPESKLLYGVYSYMHRTVGVWFINKENEIEKNWENVLYELTGIYQYEGVNDQVWDYYLIICCDFEEKKIDNKLRFRIESDRFCCRKIFVFNLSRRNFSKEKLIEGIFPHLDASKEMQIIKENTILDKMDCTLEGVIPNHLLVRQLEESEVEKILESMIKKNMQSDE